MNSIEQNIFDEAVTELRDIIAKYEVPQEYLEALTVAYARGAKNALNEAENITMKTVSEWFFENRGRTIS
jgi:hypothetical protein